MFLKFGSILAELPDFADFAPGELERTINEVERKKQKLEDDIKRYIREKQEEVTKYELELVEQQKRPMNGTSSNSGGHVNAMDCTPTSPSLPEPLSPKSERSSSPESEDAAKRKLSRVHKREKELRGLVTPVFLPLLEARDLSPKKKKRSRSKQNEGALERSDENAEQTSFSRDTGIDGDRPDSFTRSTSGDDITEMEDVAEDPALKPTPKTEKDKEKKRRPSIKKSSLRQKGTPKERRKRVSLVIDDQIVHPSDNIGDYGVTSPRSETSPSIGSASTSASDFALDPRLLHSPHSVLDPVHHSLPLPVIVHNDDDSSQVLSESPPPLDYAPLQSAARTNTDPSPPMISGALPHTASDHPIYATSPMNIDEPEIEQQEAMPSSSYVGGLSGSGVDDVDQAGSYGYPSSLGASYMESYMKSRPLSVRIAAAEKAGLAEAERRELLRENAADDDLTVERIENVEDESMGIMGDMEGF